MKGVYITILILALIAIAVWYWMKDEETSLSNNNAIIYCTLDTRICPDGSYVSRVAPSCEFTACSSQPTFTDSVLSAS